MHDHLPVNKDGLSTCVQIHTCVRTHLWAYVEIKDKRVVEEKRNFKGKLPLEYSVESESSSEFFRKERIFFFWVSWTFQNSRVTSTSHSESQSIFQTNENFPFYLQSYLWYITILLKRQYATVMFLKNYVGKDLLHSRFSLHVNPRHLQTKCSLCVSVVSWDF